MERLALPPTVFTIFSKTKTRSFPNLPSLSSMSPGSALPTPATVPQDGAAGDCALQHLQDTPHPLGSQTSSLTFGMRFSSFLGCQHLLV